jgi:DNA-binding LacI/PurR family transcriptional regulator
MESKIESKVTLEAVAKLSNVSAATVSRVINRTSRVSPAIEKRIRAAAEKLGLDLRKKNKSKLIAFCLSNRSLLYPFHSQVLLAVEACCAAQDYNVVFCPLDYSEQQGWKKLHVPRLFHQADMIDGVIVSGVNYQNLLDLLTDTGMPFAVLADTVQGEWKSSEYDTVGINDTDGAYEATRYLQFLGNKRIVYIANTRLVWFERRYKGYCRAMEEAGLQSSLSSVDSENEHDIGFLGTKEILAQGNNPCDAIFAGSDAIAYGVYSALRAADINVPADIGVCGFNDTPSASLLYPPLSSVSVFPELIGRSLAQLLLERISNPGLPAQSRCIHTQLIKRESCLPASRMVQAVL